MDAVAAVPPVDSVVCVRLEYWLRSLATKQLLAFRRDFRSSLSKLGADVSFPFLFTTGGGGGSFPVSVSAMADERTSITGPSMTLPSSSRRPCGLGGGGKGEDPSWWRLQDIDLGKLIILLYGGKAVRVYNRHADVLGVDRRELNSWVMDDDGNEKQLLSCYFTRALSLAFYLP